MKKVLWMIALMMCLVMAAGCSKDDSDEFAFERQYAEDNFKLTEGNIREKIVGEWTFEELSFQPYGEKWIDSNPEELSDVAKVVKFRPDGTGEFLGMVDMHWQVEGRDLILKQAFLCAYDKNGKALGGVQLSNGILGTTREKAEQRLKEKHPDYVTMRDSLDITVCAGVIGIGKDWVSLGSGKYREMIAVSCKLKRK